MNKHTKTPIFTTTPKLSKNKNKYKKRERRGAARDLYGSLICKRNATKDEIHKNWVKSVANLHEDKRTLLKDHKNKELSEKMIKLLDKMWDVVNFAHDVLMDPNKKLAYNSLLEHHPDYVHGDCSTDLEQLKRMISDFEDFRFI